MSATVAISTLDPTVRTGVRCALRRLDLAPNGKLAAVRTATVLKAFWLMSALAVLYTQRVRPQLIDLGATEEEAARSLPGDELTPCARFRSTMVISINEPPENIWPWLVQMGWGRGGFYSHNWIENLFGLDLHNAERIHPEWQDLAVGDALWMSHPRFEAALPATRVAELQPDRALVLEIRGTRLPPDASPIGSWSLVIEPLDEQTSRLIARLRMRARGVGRNLLLYLLVEPGHVLMQWGALRGIKQRVERGRP